MGFLLLNFKDEELTFKCFLSLMEYYLDGLFTKEFKRLKLLFYQYNRLLHICLPNLAQHFKRERVDPSCFAASWFLTLFTNAFQYTSYSHTLMKIWDIFLLQKWRGIMKISLYILKSM